MSPVVDLVGVEKTFRDFWGRARVRALSPLTLSLSAGEVLALLGPNGAGKSTTIKLVLGLLFPTRGALTVFGRKPDNATVRARIGYLPEETKLHAFLTARETLHLFGRLHGVPPRERTRRVSELLAMVGLSGKENRPVGEFSKGMARRIGLAVALVGDPDLLILDEPTSGLDPLGTREIKDLIAELRSRGRTILLSSHLLDDVEDVADRVAILYGGRLVALGTTEELLTQGERVRIEFARPAGFDPRAAAQDVRERFQVRGSVEVDNPAARLETLFREVVSAAAAERSEVSGAQAGGDLASFLGTGEGGAEAETEAETETETEAETEAEPETEAEAETETEAEAETETETEPETEAEAEAETETEAEAETETETSAPQNVGEELASSLPSETEAEAETEVPLPAGRGVLAGLLEPTPAAAEPSPAAEPLKGGAGRAVLAGLLAPPAKPEAPPVAPAAKLARQGGRDVLGALVAKGNEESSPTPEAPTARPAPKLSAAGRDVLDGLLGEQRA